jgi:hypothetical protein
MSRKKCMEAEKTGSGDPKTSSLDGNQEKKHSRKRVSITEEWVETGLVARGSCSANSRMSS